MHTGNSTGTPRYLELAEKLRTAIQKGDYAPGALIGSEYELARRENLARMTVRRTSQLLVNEGLIERRPGKGLYVRGPRTATRTVQFIAGNLQWECAPTPACSRPRPRCCGP